MLAKKIDASKRLTAGILFSAGHIGCDKELLYLVQETSNKCNSAALLKALKVLKTYYERKNTIEEFCSKGVIVVDPSNQKTKDLQILINWYCQEGNASIPKIVKECKSALQQQKQEVICKQKNI